MRLPEALWPVISQVWFCYANAAGHGSLTLSCMKTNESAPILEVK